MRSRVTIVRNLVSKKGVGAKFYSLFLYKIKEV
nr:MAG TPA: hypothetical protein [Caudoviricetes sp.]